MLYQLCQIVVIKFFKRKMNFCLWTFFPTRRFFPVRGIQFSGCFVPGMYLFSGHCFVPGCLYQDILYRQSFFQVRLYMPCNHTTYQRARLLNFFNLAEYRCAVDGNPALAYITQARMTGPQSCVISWPSSDYIRAKYMDMYIQCTGLITLVG